METNIVMKSKDRDLFGVVIKQETKNGFLSLTELQKAYEIARWQYGWSEINIASLMQGSKFKIQLYNCLFEKKLIDNSLIEFNNIVIDIGITKYLKRNNLWITTGKAITKNVFCHELIFKIIAINLFGSMYYSVEPAWLRLIEVSVRTSLRRDDSFELNFINILIDKLGFLSDEVKKQFILQAHRYDLYLNIFNKKLLIEYNEKQHLTAEQIAKDKLKYELAIKEGYCYIVVPCGNESDELSFIKEVLSNSISNEDVNELSYFRFDSLLDKKYSIAINERVFGKHLTGMRNLATSNELKKITKIEQFINQGISIGMIKDEKQVMYSIANFSL